MYIFDRASAVSLTGLFIMRGLAEIERMLKCSKSVQQSPDQVSIFQQKGVWGVNFLINIFQNLYGNIL